MGFTMKDSPEHSEFYKQLGANIRKNRLALGRSQDELARGIGLTRTSLTNIENGRQHPPLHTFCDIAEQLKIDPSALLPVRAAPVQTPDFMAVAEKQVRGDNELSFITAGIGIKNEDKPHDHAKKKNRDTGSEALGRKRNNGSARSSRQDRKG
jgi:transcriptional regulator with XRE-family HTH domain